MSGSKRSVVEYFAEHEGYSCGYCKSSNTSYSHGMWGHYLTPQDYQDLINRGWRRSGKYCYKPTLQLTCCPQYTIRCEALNFKPSKSQKKVLKKVHRFLADGHKQKNYHSACPMESDNNPMDYSDRVKPSNIEYSEDNMDFCCSLTEENPGACKNKLLESMDDKNSNSHISVPVSSELEQKTVENHISETSSSCSRLDSSGGPDPSRPPCRKAKDIRIERKLQKLLKSGLSENEARKIMAEKKKQRISPEKSLEDLLSKPYTHEPLHKLEQRLIPSDITSPLFTETYDISCNVYHKYQIAIHKDPPEKCSKKQYTRFLVNSPFQYIDDNQFLSGNIYGSFHQQYWLDDKLIAVGVIDILPQCVSSVYLYYDPEYSFLSLGTYAALREIAFTRELSKTYPSLKYYYMGFYIHSCPKMRYKGHFFPSFLLCPETYIFQPIEKCVPKLDISKYHRLEEDPKKEDVDGVVNLGDVMVLYERTAMDYLTCCRSKNTADDDVQQYAKLVGQKCYKRMLLYRS